MNYLANGHDTWLHELLGKWKCHMTSWITWQVEMSHDFMNYLASGNVTWVHELLGLCKWYMTSSIIWLVEMSHDFMNYLASGNVTWLYEFVSCQPILLPLWIINVNLSLQWNASCHYKFLVLATHTGSKTSIVYLIEFFNWSSLSIGGVTDQWLITLKVVKFVRYNMFTWMTKI